MKKKYELRKEDEELFSKMEGSYVSENEKIVFETQRYKEEYVPTVTKDLLMHESLNSDNICVYRENLSDYAIGHGTAGRHDKEVRVKTFAEALAVNLREAGFIEQDMTLWEWFRARDYVGVEYALRHSTEWKNELRKEDQELFSKMEGNYISENEKIFFETQRYKEEYVPTGMNDLVMHEDSNEDNIYIVRVDLSEYFIGHGTYGHYDEEVYVMTLAEALAVNLREAGFIEQDMTLLEWLRARDYAGVEYDHNYDDE